MKLNKTKRSEKQFLAIYKQYEDDIIRTLIDQAIGNNIILENIEGTQLNSYHEELLYDTDAFYEMIEKKIDVYIDNPDDVHEEIQECVKTRKNYQYLSKKDLVNLFYIESENANPWFEYEFFISDEDLHEFFDNIHNLNNQYNLPKEYIFDKYIKKLILNFNDCDELNLHNDILDSNYSYFRDYFKSDRFMDYCRENNLTIDKIAMNYYLY